MSVKNWQAYAAGIAGSEIVGMIAGFLTRADTKIYAASVVKPPLAPPGWVFPIAWTLLYALMGLGAARVYLREASPERSRALGVFGLQLLFNFCWCFIFFSLQAFGAALIWLLLLLALAVWMAALFCKIDKSAGLPQAPYLLWLMFAAYLNGGVYMLN